MCLNRFVTYVGESYRGETFAHFGSLAKVGRPRGAKQEGRAHAEAAQKSHPKQHVGRITRNRLSASAVTAEPIAGGVRSYESVPVVRDN